MMEVIIASFLLAFLSLLLLGLVLCGQKTYQQTSIAADLEARGVNAMAVLVRDVAQARVVSVSAQNDRIDLQVPVSVGGSVLDSQGNIQWGYDNQIGWTVRYLAVPESVLDEAAAQVDVNQNGVMEVFVLCRIEQQIVNPVGAVTRTMVVDREVLLRQTPRNGAVGTGSAADPLFSLTSTKSILINLWHARLDSDRKPYLRQARTEISLRNSS